MAVSHGNASGSNCRGKWQEILDEVKNTFKTFMVMSVCNCKTGDYTVGNENNVFFCSLPCPSLLFIWCMHIQCGL